MKVGKTQQQQWRMGWEYARSLDTGARYLLATFQMIRNAGHNLRPSFEEQLLWLHRMDKEGHIKALPPDWRDDLGVREWVEEVDEAVENLQSADEILGRKD